jgi:hypothetical protein
MKLLRTLAIRQFIGLFLAFCFSSSVLAATLLNGRDSLITQLGGTPGVNDLSLAQTGLGMTYGGFAGQSGNYRLADNFIVPSSGWRVDSITVYPYQTGSTTASTITALTLEIWRGRPGDVGSVIVFGDTVTNRLTSTAFAGIYRASSATPADTSRPVMSATASGLNLTLPAGDYWAYFSAAGSLGSGPWFPPITTAGQTTTGDARQFQVVAAIWVDVQDVGLQGIPLTINGDVLSVAPVVVPVGGGWFTLLLAFGLVATLFGAMRGRAMKRVSN